MQQGLSRPGHDWWERWWGTRPQNKSDAELHNLRHICNLHFSMSSFVLWNTLPFFAETENPNLFWLGWFPLLRNTKRKAGSGSTRALRSPLAPLNWHSEEKWTLFSDHVFRKVFGTNRSVQFRSFSYQIQTYFFSPVLFRCGKHLLKSCLRLWLSN